MIPSQESVKGGAVVTPSDATLLPRTTRALLATVAGNVSVLMEDGSALILPIAAGVLLHVSVKRVNATGTTATGIVALW